MGLTQVSTDGVKNDAITKTKIPANQIEASELADNAVDTNAIADNAVSSAKIPTNAVTQAKIADDAVGADQLASNAVVTASIADNAITQAKINVPISNRNLIINGSMIIDQRNNGASAAVGNNYLIDRFEFNKNNDGAGTCQQVSDAPAGFKKSLKFTVTTQDSSLSATEYMYVRQIIEGNDFNVADFGTANAKSITLTFYVKSSVTGTFSGSIWNDAFNRSNVFTYTISSANTWEKKTITFTGDTSGTWETGISRGLNIGWSLGLGSNFLSGTTNSWQGAGKIGSTGSVNLINTNNATWQLTGVQLELGSVATDFEHKTYQDEIKRCMRYFQKIHGTQMTGAKNTNSRMRMNAAFMEPMRGTPSYSRTSNNLSFQLAATNTQSSDQSEAQGGNTGVSDGISYSRQWDFGGFTNLADRSYIGNTPFVVFTLDSEL